jgi:hypothetical protein
MIDAEMLLRTLMAWLRGEPRVCSMVPIPSEADEEAPARAPGTGGFDQGAAIDRQTRSAAFGRHSASFAGRSPRAN